MIKRFIIAFILLVLICGGIVGFNMFRDKAIQDYFASAPKPSLTVSTQKVEPVTWTPNIDAIGTVSASSGVDLTVETTGIVKDILFVANQKVKAGDVLVQLDDAVERADVEATKAQAELDKTALARAIELQKRGVGSDVTVDSANAAATTSAANVAKLQAVLDQKQLRAPFSGTVGIPRIDDGQYLSPGTIVVTLQDLDTMRADFTVPEQQLDQLKMGQAVRLGTDQENWPFDGTVTGIDPKVDPATRLVSVRAKVGNPDGKLSPGQFVQVQVVLPEESNVLAVSQTAVVTSLYGDYVFLVAPPEPAKPVSEQAASDASAPAPAATPAPEAETPAETGASPAPAAPALAAKQVFVKVGRRSQGLIEVTDGLKPGDEIVTAGQNRITNGSPLTVDNKVDPTKVASQP